MALAPHPTLSQHGWCVLSRQARKMRSRTDVAAFARAGALARDLIHPTILSVSEAPFFSGDYQGAVSRAFAEIEMTVRQAASHVQENLDGVKLVRAAFDPENGSLRYEPTQLSERQAIAHLFAGAFGAFRNPASHRRVPMEPEQAAQLLVLASHLVQVVESRAPAKGG